MRDSGSGVGRPAIRSYDDLECYQRAMKLLAPVHTLALSFPEYERYELASQLRRACKSVLANIAEGYGKKASAREFKAYLNNALGSANEVIVHLKIANELGYARDAGSVDDLIAGYTVVARQLYRLREAWRDFSMHESNAIPSPASRVSHPNKEE